MFNRRRGRRKKNRIIVWFSQLSKMKKILLCLGLVFVILFGSVIGYASWVFSRLGKNEVKEEEIAVNEELINKAEKEDLGDGYTNFVLFGSDSREKNVKQDLNTDSIIIISLNNETKEVKMVSVYRDTLMDLSNGTINKCNSAYARGGATQALSMLNTNLDLQIKKYVTIDFSIVVDVIDILGGIEVDVTEAEMKAMNDYIWETAMVAGVEPVLISQPGYQLLDGAQATTYARIRKGVGDDYARTERQRLVIQKVVQKAVTAGLGTINEIIDKAFPRISTNFTMIEILKYAQWFDEYKFGQTSGFPFEYGSETIPGKGSCVYALDMAKDVSKLHEFLFGTIDYTPTSIVQEIDSEVNSIVNRAVSKPSSQNSSSGSNSQKQEATESQTTQQGTSNSGSSNSQTTKPETTTPDTSKPNTSTPGTTTPDTSTPGNSGSGTSTPETSTPETSNPDTSTPDTSTPDTSTPNSGETTSPDANSGNTSTGQTATQ